MDLSEVKNLLLAQGKAWEEFKKTNDALIKAKADGQAVSDLETKLAKIETDLNKIDEIKQAVATLERAAARPQLPDGAQPGAKLADECKAFNDHRKTFVRPGHVIADVEVDEYKAYKDAWIKQVRHGKENLTTDEVKAMQAGVDPDGGYMLPPPMVGRIVQKVYELTPLRQICTVQTISGNEIEGIEDLDEAALGGWVSETAARDETNTPQVGKWKIEAHEMYAQPKVTQRILDDSAVDVEAWLANKIANKYARVEADAFVNGSGVGRPRGLCQYPTAQTADATRPWGTFEAVKSGFNGGFASSNPADVLFDLVGAMKPAYLGNARWVTTRQVITAIRKFKEATTNGYLWQPGLQAGQPDRLLAYPVVMCQDMPALASGSLSLSFGDFAEAYTIVDRLGIRTLRDPYTSKPYIKFYSTRRVGGGAVNFEAVKFMVFSA